MNFQLQLSVTSYLCDLYLSEPLCLEIIRLVSQD